MIEYIHKDPLAFGRKWQPVSKFHHDADFNFGRFNYRVMGVIFDRESKEFRNVLAQVNYCDPKEVAASCFNVTF